MEQAIIDALIAKLYSVFPTVKAYDVKMDMQVEPPMFVISCYNRQRADRITRGGFFYTYYFEIIFFPGHDEPELMDRDVELELQDAVWLFGNTFRGDDIRSTNVDGILHLFFSVTVPLKADRPSPPDIREIRMETYVDERKVSSETIKTTS